jgi:hypothetical protein
MKITITNTFKKAAKKLHANQIIIVEDTIDAISQDPEIGELKKGDLAGVKVCKFHINSQLMLMAYVFVTSDKPDEQELTLLSLSTHENFYRDLKK